MLTNRNARVQAEEETLGRASVWTEVHRQMRCPGSCPLGPHCWRDLRNEKHYKLLSEVGQPAQCKWRPLIGQREITAYVISAGSSLPSFLYSHSFRSFCPS
jgi:hypothetical protein